LGGKDERSEDRLEKPGKRTSKQGSQLGKGGVSQNTCEFGGRLGTFDKIAFVEQMAKANITGNSDKCKGRKGQRPKVPRGSIAGVGKRKKVDFNSNGTTRPIGRTQVQPSVERGQGSEVGQQAKSESTGEKSENAVPSLPASRTLGEKTLYRLGAKGTGGSNLQG